MSSYPPPPNLPDVLPGEDGGSYASRKAEQRVALISAIRRFTVDDPDGAPNGRAEAAMEALSLFLDPKAWRGLSDHNRALLDQANGAAGTLCEAMADDTKALREAAEAYLGGDFRLPGFEF